ncbi:hypothetical protein Taro_024175 [Colocasia esculenta]|uniref:Uncharacterized protein n=1 Tax=Colocasia esculenta TaxID=4460 RepID=A0A843UZL6_COLES|nr:hypothetical protein [Colocasia esculenta]
MVKRALALEAANDTVEKIRGRSGIPRITPETIFPRNLDTSFPLPANPETLDLVSPRSSSRRRASSSSASSGFAIAVRASTAAGATSSVGEGGRRSVVASLFFDSVFFLVHPRPFSLVCPRRRGLGGSAAASRVGFRYVELKRKVPGVPFDSVNDTLISALSESARK